MGKLTAIFISPKLESSIENSLNNLESEIYFLLSIDSIIFFHFGSEFSAFLLS